MALISKASLLMVPSTYEPGTLFNVLPSGNRAPDSTDQNSGYDQTRADFDFDRGSNAAATRVNADGLIEKYRENHILYSNTFDTGWSLSLATLTSGQSGYDGTNDAWLLNSIGVNARINQNLSLDVCSVSVYAKAGSVNFIRLSTAVANMNAYFDLANGTIGTLESGVIDATIESVGNGWYRCAMSVSSSNTIRILVAQADGDSSGTSGNIYIQDCQVEKSLVATDYLNSTSVTGKAGVLVDLPRINYDANGENGALLLEPSRQQLIQYSEWFGDSSWIKSSSVVVTSNASTSPEGVENAGLVEFPASTNRSLVYVVSGISSNTDYTFSLYIKKVSGSPSDTDLKMTIYGDVVSSVTNNIGSDISGEWQRFDVTATTNGSASSLNLQLRSEVLQSMYIFAAQCEAGSYPSSYIPNHGESGGVTRAADSMQILNNTIADISSGVLFMELEGGLRDDAGFRFQLATIGSETSNRVFVSYKSDGKARMYSVKSGSLQADNTSSTIISSGNVKIAARFDANNMKLYMNGSVVGSDTNCQVPTGLNKVTIGRVSDGQLVTKGILKQVAVFNEALSDSELATLTTL